MCPHIIMKLTWQDGRYNLGDALLDELIKLLKCKITTLIKLLLLAVNRHSINKLLYIKMQLLFKVH